MLLFLGFAYIVFLALQFAKGWTVIIYHHPCNDGELSALLYELSLLPGKMWVKTLFVRCPLLQWMSGIFIWRMGLMPFMTDEKKAEIHRLLSRHVRKVVMLDIVLPMDAIPGHIKVEIHDHHEGNTHSVNQFANRGCVCHFQPQAMTGAVKMMSVPNDAKEWQKDLIDLVGYVDMFNHEKLREKGVAHAGFLACALKKYLGQYQDFYWKHKNLTDKLKISWFVKSWTAHVVRSLDPICWLFLFGSEECIQDIIRSCDQMEEEGKRILMDDLYLEKRTSFTGLPDVILIHAEQGKRWDARIHLPIVMAIFERETLVSEVVIATSKNGASVRDISQGRAMMVARLAGGSGHAKAAGAQRQKMELALRTNYITAAYYKAVVDEAGKLYLAIVYFCMSIPKLLCISLKIKKLI